MPADNEEAPSAWLGDHEVLGRAAQRIGLDATAAMNVLADPSAFAAELEEGLSRSASLGVSGVPGA